MKTYLTEHTLSNFELKKAQSIDELIPRTPANCTFETPIGPIRIACDGLSITSITTGLSEWIEDKQPASPLLRQAKQEILEFLDGTRKEFTFLWCISGTPFLNAVRQAACDIPYGQTMTYKQLAQAAGNPKAARAAAKAMSSNTLPLVIPCHRVIPSNGGIGRYSFAKEEESKQMLLDMERNVLASEQA